MRSRPRGVLAAGSVAACAAILLSACSAGSGPTASGPSGPTSSATTSTSSSPSTTVLSAAGCARSLVDGMDPRGRAAQLLMVGLPASDAADGVGLVRSGHVGGVFLAGRSSLGVARTRTAVDALQAAALAATGVRLEVGADQEGGLVQTLKGPGFSTIPRATVQGGWSSSTLRAAAARWAAQMVAAGVTLDLAPVADTVAPDFREDNPPIGFFGREYGGDPAVVAAKVTAVVTGMQSAGLGTTVKHFPGLGRVDANTDTSTDAVDDRTDADDPNLQPFAAAIGAGTTAVMVSSASYPRLDPAHVAMFSPAVVTGLLRQRLRFTGLVVSDDVGRAVAVQGLTPAQRALAFVGAGGDMVLTVVPADVAPMTTALVTRAGADAAFADQVDAAAYRVLLTKVQAGLARCG